MATNLPSQVIEDSAAGTKLYFDSYGEAALEFNANDVQYTQGFFESKGFDNDAATTVTMTLLRQAKIDGTPVGQIVDSLQTFNRIQLSQVVSEILNNNRVPTSILGYRTTDVKPNQIRNISA
jgi:hypothetical protein